MTPFEQLNQKLQSIADIRGSVSLLAWDQETFMPKGGAAKRARHMSTLQGIYHKQITTDANDLLKAVEDAGLDGLSPRQQLNVRQLRKDIDRLTKLPIEHVIASTKAASEAVHVWAKARATDDYAMFAPNLSQLLELKIKEADYLGYEDNPYDALLDTFEPGMKASMVENTFNSVKDELRELLGKIVAQPQVDDSFLGQDIEEEKQMAYGLAIAEQLGFDTATGRLDKSVHPFTISMDSSDVRITTRVQLDDIRDMLYSTVHEAGHAIYEQGLNGADYGWPGSESCSLSIHESQSRLWENNVARSLPYWKHHFKSFAELYPDGLQGRNPEEVFRAVNLVEPNLIRIASDELTYHFHIILRFELEDALVNGRLSIADLPAAWNEKVKSYLGLDVPNNAQGVLQDIHWSHGSFGYFPTYSLGSFYAAQFMAAAGRDFPDLQGQFERGEFGPLKTWLNEQIHDHGKLHDSEAICKMVTGEGLNVKYFMDYAKDKFGRVYGL